MSSQSNQSLLSFRNVSVSYGGVHAIRDLSFDVYSGDVFCLLGANGAGKTTVLKAIMGLIKPRQGSIIFKRDSILDWPTHQRVEFGMSLAPEGRGIFLNLSVFENLQMGSWFKTKKEDFEWGLERAFRFFPRLKERVKQNAGTLSGGEQQMLAIARAMMNQPELLLLDEPSLGLAPQYIETIFEVINMLHIEGVSIILVEQNAVAALKIANTALLLENGQQKMKGAASDILSSSEIQESYLGVSD